VSASSCHISSEQQFFGQRGLAGVRCALMAKVRHLLISKDISSSIVSLSLNYESAPHEKWWRERMVTLYDGLRSSARSAIH
jgi:hypothetical protein